MSRGYPMKWQNDSADPAIKSGTMTFRIEGKDYTIPLPTFEDAMTISKMMDACFDQGKDFAFNAIRSHVNTAFNNADSMHSLTLFRPSNKSTEKQS